MKDFRQRRSLQAEAEGKIDGISWVCSVDGKITRYGGEKRVLEEDQGTAGRHSKKRHLGDVLFADDTAVIAEADEHKIADACMKQTMKDWEERCNEDKKEMIVLQPGGQPLMHVGRQFEKKVVKHVGANLEADGGYDVDTQARANKARAAVFILKSSWGAAGGKRVKRVNRSTRLRVLKAMITPILTTFCKTRPWTKKHIAKLSKVQGLAVRMGYGITQHTMRTHHLRHNELYKAAGWTSIEILIKRHTLMWLGHVARMHPTRLPKLTLLGWAEGGTYNRGGGKTQISWIKEVLKDARIPELDWFRLAQNKGKNGLWQWIIDRAFPVNCTYKGQNQRLQKWKPGHPLPDPPRKRRRIHAEATPGIMSASTERGSWECPVCSDKFTTSISLTAHYGKYHEVVDPAVTTHLVFSCAKCGQHFSSKTKRAEHECPMERPHVPREGEGPDGWLPYFPVTADVVEDELCIYTDGSGPEPGQKTAGWGVAIFNQSDRECQLEVVELMGPVVTDKYHHLYEGADRGTNNTGELCAIIEAGFWLWHECPRKPLPNVSFYYDSKWAASMAQGSTNPSAHQQLCDKAKSLINLLKTTTSVGWKWVKGHSGEAGNEKADKLANRGRKGEVSVQSKRHSEPMPSFYRDQPVPQEELETCRKCGRTFGNNPRTCGYHEKHCGEGVLENPGYMQCRKCGEWVGAGSEDRIRERRRKHEDVCRGALEANLTCPWCGYKTPADTEDALARHRRHEGMCGAREIDDVDVKWKCACGYKAFGRKWKELKQQHIKKKHSGEEPAAQNCGASAV
jgi:ribonuclease HI